MKRCLIVFIAVLFIVANANAAGFVFSGVGGNFQMNQNYGDLDVDAGFAFTGGYGQSLGDKWVLLTIFDYSERKFNRTGDIQESDSSGVLFEKNTLGSVGLLLNNPTDRFKVYLLGGLEISDGNVPEYDSFISIADGLLATYEIIQDRNFYVWVAGTNYIGGSYVRAKLRAGLSYGL